MHGGAVSMICNIIRTGFKTINRVRGICLRNGKLSASHLVLVWCGGHQCRSF